MRLSADFRTQWFSQQVSVTFVYIADTDKYNTAAATTVKVQCIYNSSRSQFVLNRHGKHCINTEVIYVGEVDAVDLQCRSQVNRPPRVCVLIRCTHTGSVNQVRAVAAIVSVGGNVSAVLVGPRTALERRTIQSHVHIETSIHRHCTPHHDVTASTEVIEVIDFDLLYDEPRRAATTALRRSHNNWHPSTW